MFEESRKIWKQKLKERIESGEQIVCCICKTPFATLRKVKKGKYACESCYHIAVLGEEDEEND